MINKEFYKEMMEEMNPENVELSPIEFKTEEEFDKYCKEEGIEGEWEGEGLYDRWGIADGKGFMASINKILITEGDFDEDFNFELANADFKGIKEEDIKEAIEELENIYPGVDNWYYPGNDGLGWSGWKVYKANYNSKTFLIAEGVFNNFQGKYLFYVNDEWKHKWCYNYPAIKIFRNRWYIDFGNVAGNVNVEEVDIIEYVGE